MSGKGHAFNDFLTNTLADIVICTETHFSSNTDLAPFTAGTNLEFTCFNRETHGGGVAIVTRATLGYNKLDYTNDTNLETITVINDKTLICCVYWPPQEGRQVDSLESLLRFLSQYSETRTSILVGDFNLRGVTRELNYEISPFSIPCTEAARPFERDAIELVEAAHMHQIV